MNVKSGEKGYFLEEQLRAYFSLAGYFVLRGVPYQFDGDEITDVDLWMYERPAATTRRRTIVDIKNKRTPKSAERVIWVRGLQEALQVDAAMVSTTDKRESVKKLARRLGILLLDGDVTARMLSSEQLSTVRRLTGDEFDAFVRSVDDNRGSKDWIKRISESKNSILAGFGIQSANANLSACRYFAEQVVLGHNDSPLVKIAARAVYLCAALAAVSLDYVTSEAIFGPLEDRKRNLVEGLRFGQSDETPSLANVNLALGLVRQFADNGSAVAKNVEKKFFDHANQIPAEIIAEFVSKNSTRDTLFNIGRHLEERAYELTIAPFDALNSDCKSFIGVVLDFNGISREKFARAWKASQEKAADGMKDMPMAGPLFNKSAQTK